MAADGSALVLAEWSYARPGELRVRFFAPDGAELRSWYLEFQPIPVARQVRDSVVSAGLEAVRSLAERLWNQGIAEERLLTITPAEVEETVYLPSHYPPLRRVLLGLDSTIWIERMDGMHADSWLVLDLDGKLLFQTGLAAGMTLRQVSSDAVWATARDDLDVPYLIRYDLRE